MKTSRIAVAAVLASLSAPALAGGPGYPGLSYDGTQPVIDHPAPAVEIGGKGDGAAIADADPTQPRTDAAAPVVALRRGEGAPVVEAPSAWAPQDRYLVETPVQAPAQRVAKAP